MSKEIQGIALSLNADAPFLRPVELAQDCTPSISVVKHSLTYFENNNESFDAVCLLQPTSPFRRIGFIDKCINEFKNRGAYSSISWSSLFPLSTTPIGHSWRMKEDFLDITDRWRLSNY